MPVLTRTAAPFCSGQVAFVAGVADNTGYGWAIARQLSSAGATVLVGTFPPALAILKRSMRGNGQGVISGIYPLDATFSTPEEIPDDVRVNRRSPRTPPAVYARLSTTLFCLLDISYVAISHIDMAMHRGPTLILPHQI